MSARILRRSWWGKYGHLSGCKPGWRFRAGLSRVKWRPGADAGRASEAREGAGASKGRGLDGGLVVADPVDLQPGHEGRPGAGHLKQADADHHGAADPG